MRKEFKNAGKEIKIYKIFAFLKSLN